MYSQTKLFRSVARDHMGPKPVEVARTASVGEAVNSMAQAGSRVTIVTDSHGRPAGILTEQDVVRRVAWRAMPDQPRLGRQRMVSLVRHWGTCPICAAEVDLDEGGAAFPGRLVGRCHDAPDEHVFSFDPVSLEGSPMRNFAPER